MAFMNGYNQNQPAPMAGQQKQPGQQQQGYAQGGYGAGGTQAGGYGSSGYQSQGGYGQSNSLQGPGHDPHAGMYNAAANTPHPLSQPNNSPMGQFGNVQNLSGPTGQAQSAAGGSHSASAPAGPMATPGMQPATPSQGAYDPFTQKLHDFGQAWANDPGGIDPMTKWIQSMGDKLHPAFKNGATGGPDGAKDRAGVRAQLQSMLDAVDPRNTSQVEKNYMDLAGKLNHDDGYYGQQSASKYNAANWQIQADRGHQAEQAAAGYARRGLGGSGMSSAAQSQVGLNAGGLQLQAQSDADQYAQQLRNQDVGNLLQAYGGYGQAYNDKWGRFNNMAKTMADFYGGAIGGITKAAMPPTPVSPAGGK